MPKKKISKTVYLDGVDWQYEVGEAYGGNLVHPSLKDTEESHPCVQQCGVVECDLVFNRWVKPQNFDAACTKKLGKIFLNKKREAYLKAIRYLGWSKQRKNPPDSSDPSYEEYWKEQIDRYKEAMKIVEEKLIDSYRAIREIKLLKDREELKNDRNTKKLGKVSRKAKK